MKDYARKFYKSPAWKRMRAYVIKRDGGLCRECWGQGRLTPAAEVHHIIEITPDNIDDPDVALNPENLISLCRECHKARHGIRTGRYTFDELGRVIIK